MAVICAGDHRMEFWRSQRYNADFEEGIFSVDMKGNLKGSHQRRATAWLNFAVASPLSMIDVRR